MPRGILNEPIFGEFGYMKAGFEQALLFHCGFYFGGRVTGSPGCVFHLKAAGLAEDFMPTERGGAQGEARIAGRRLNEDLFEGDLAEDFSVCYAIECHTTGEAERFGAGMR